MHRCSLTDVRHRLLRLPLFPVVCPGMLNLHHLLLQQTEALVALVWTTRQKIGGKTQLEQVEAHLPTMKMNRNPRAPPTRKIGIACQPLHKQPSKKPNDNRDSRKTTTTIRTKSHLRKNQVFLRQIMCEKHLTITKKRDPWLQRPLPIFNQLKL